MEQAGGGVRKWRVKWFSSSHAGPEGHSRPSLVSELTLSAPHKHSWTLWVDGN